MNDKKVLIYKNVIDIRQVCDQILNKYGEDPELKFYIEQILERVERILIELRKW